MRTTEARIKDWQVRRMNHLAKRVCESDHRGQSQGLAGEEDGPEPKQEARGLEAGTTTTQVQHQG